MRNDNDPSREEPINTSGRLSFNPDQRRSLRASLIHNSRPSLDFWNILNNALKRSHVILCVFKSMIEDSDQKACAENLYKRYSQKKNLNSAENGHVREELGYSVLKAEEHNGIRLLGTFKIFFFLKYLLEIISERSMLMNYFEIGLFLEP